MKVAQWFRTKLEELIRIEDSPRAIATGLSVGVFFGFVPLIGLKMVLALFCTRLLRGNLIAAAIAVALHDVLLPVAPLLLRWEYDLGYWMLQNPHAFPPSMRWPEGGPLQWLSWSQFFAMGRPLLLGSLVLATPVSLLCYALSRRLLQHYQRRRMENDSSR